MGIPSPTERDIADACEATGLAEVIMRHPMGLGLPITEGVWLICWPASTGRRDERAVVPAQGDTIG